jgi:UDP-perosamine 4-acetyltransferase
VRLLVVGAGGHAKVVIDAARMMGWTVVAVTGTHDDAAEVLGIPVSRDAEGIDADGFIIAVGNNRIRARLFDEYRGGGLHPLSVIHPSAVIASGVRIGAGAFVAAGAVINIDATIGEDAIVNTGCTVDHDCVVGDHALVGPTASLCGESRIGAGVTFGAGASIIPVKHVGDWTVIGAGAAVVDDVPARAVFAGVPARRVGTVEDPA